MLERTRYESVLVKMVRATGSTGEGWKPVYVSSRRTRSTFGMNEAEERIRVSIFLSFIARSHELTGEQGAHVHALPASAAPSSLPFVTAAVMPVMGSWLQPERGVRKRLEKDMMM